MRISYGRVRGPDTTPATEIMYKHALGAQKGPKATKKTKNKMTVLVVMI